MSARTLSEQHEQQQAAAGPAEVVGEEPAEVGSVEALLESGHGLPQSLVVGLNELYRGRRPEQVGCQRLLLACDRPPAGDALQGGRRAFADDAQVAVDAEVDDGGGEGAIVEAHAIDIAHGSRRHAIGRRKQRDDGAGAGVATDPHPGERVEAEQ